MVHLHIKTAMIAHDHFKFGVRMVIFKSILSCSMQLNKQQAAAVHTQNLQCGSIVTTGASLTLPALKLTIY